MSVIFRIHGGGKKFNFVKGGVCLYLDLTHGGLPIIICKIMPI